MEWYVILIGLYGIGVVWLIWEAVNAPTYPNDYDEEYPN